MDNSLRKFRYRLRIIIILYTFCERQNETEEIYGLFKNEIKIQALDFLLRYPDFLSLELLDLLDHDNTLDHIEIKNTILSIYEQNEPELRIEEMEKFFHGAYESIDEVIAFLVSVGFLKHDSKKRIDGKTYDKHYYITKACSHRIETTLTNIESVKWFFDRCSLIKKYFDKFSGTELKQRQYQYSEYSVSYKSYIQNVNTKVRDKFRGRFNLELP